jgi:hypothetical protein
MVDGMSSEKFDLPAWIVVGTFSERERAIAEKGYQAGYLKAQESLGQRDREIAEAAFEAGYLKRCYRRDEDVMPGDRMDSTASIEAKRYWASLKKEGEG